MFYNRQVAEQLPEIVDFDEVEIVHDSSLSDFDEFSTLKGGKSESFHFNHDEKITSDYADIEANFFKTRQKDFDDDYDEKEPDEFDGLNSENNNDENNNNDPDGLQSTANIVTKNHFSFRLKFLEKQKAWVEKAARRLSFLST